MKRRNFIQLSSFSAVSILLSRLTSFAATGPSINLPGSVMLLIDDGWKNCTGSNATTFKYRDIIVTLNQSANSTAVHLTSPALAVKEVKLIWQHYIGDQTRCLGDHWERTYGDLHWHKPEFAKKEPWYVFIHDQQNTACFGVKTGCNSICWWNVEPNILQLTMDTRCGGEGVLLGKRNLILAEIVTSQGTTSETVFETTSRFCKLMCDAPRLPKQPVYGINDWYYAYGNNSPELILQQTKLMAELVTNTQNRPFSVIDAGWAEYAPKLAGDCCWQDDLSRPNKKFKDMALTASQIKEAGMRPGLWTRPLCAHHRDSESLLLPKIAGRNNPLNPVLDPTIPENIERVKRNIDIYHQWGFEMVKHDFSTYDIMGKWGFQMQGGLTEEGWHFADRTKTTAEVINNLYRSIREAAGNMYLIGCNTVSHLSAGLFELNRIGDDTSGKEWSRTRQMGVNTLAFRMCQHKNFYAADGDCVGLTNQVPWEKNRQWMQLLAESSTPLFISAQPDALGEAQKAFIKTCFAQAAKEQPIGEPLNWLEQPLPNEWKLNNQRVRFDWN